VENKVGKDFEHIPEESVSLLPEIFHQGKRLDID